MQNKPKYTLFKNTRYALAGVLCAIKTEMSFKLELLCAFFIIIAIIFIDVSLSYKLILLSTAILVLIVELLNSAIENVVDLVTKDYHELAKNAKDLGSSAVFFSICLHVSCWVFVLFSFFMK